MKVFLAIAAILAWFFGAMLLFIPASVYIPTGITVTPTLATLAPTLGATLLGLGIINWLARRADKTGLIVVLGANLFVQILSLAVVLRTLQLGAGSMAVPGVAIHVTLGSLFAFFLLKARKLESTSTL